MTAPAPRPRVVTAGFWCWVVASVMLMVGGLIAASVGLPKPYRAAGVMTVVVGGAMAFLAGRVRSGGDARFRRAAVALSLTIVALVALVSAFGVVHIVTLLAVFPLLAGAVLVTRPRGVRREETS